MFLYARKLKIVFSCQYYHSSHWEHWQQQNNNEVGTTVSCLCSLASCIFGNGFRSLADRVFCKLTWQKQSNSCLYFPRRNRRLFVVVRQTRCFLCYSLENVIHKRVHNTHCFGRNPRVWMNLFKDFINVCAIAFFSFLRVLLLLAR